MGPMKFHEWLGGSWGILFSHPADFTPVCTTEIGRMSLKYKELAEKGVKVAALSCNALGEHQKWLDDVVAHCENKITVDFPISECDLCVDRGRRGPAPLIRGMCSRTVLY